MADTAAVQRNQAAAQIQLRQRLLGRFSGPEFFFNQAFAISTTPFLNRAVGVGEPLESLHLVFRGRAVIAVASYSVVAAEAPMTLLTRVLITGISTAFGQQTILDMSGGTLFNYMRCFQIRGNSFYTGTGSQTRQADTGVPNATLGATFGNTGTYDIEIHWRIPFGPVLGPQGTIDGLPFLLRAKDWAQGLQVQLFFGDNTALGTPGGGTTVTWTAWGSGAGTPSLYIYTNSALLGGLDATYPAALLLRAERTVPAGVTAIGNAIVLGELNKVRTPNIVIKQGLSLAASPANVFASLNELTLGNIQVMVNNNPIRNFQDWWAIKEYYGSEFNTILPGGYVPLSFVESGRIGPMLPANTIDPAARFQLIANVLTAGATQQVNYIQEQVLGDFQNRMPGGVQ